ncbi:MAG: hypothetical protein V4471_07380 [Pseudomonadota bacterium]
MYSGQGKKDRRGWSRTIYDNVLWMSGQPYPDIPHLRGNLFSGQLSQL